MTAAVRREAGGGRRYEGRRMLVVGLGLSGVSALRYLAREGADLVITDSRPAPKDGAAMQTEFPEFEYRFGGFSALEPLTQFSEAVLSPGVDLREPFVQQLRAAGVPVIGDIELFARHLAASPVSRLPSPAVIGITGSNGKSTVTTLLGEMAKAAGLKVGVGGNLGPPALDLLCDDAQLYVLELSSFQLETTYSLRCKAATILNLSEDHLDRHGDMAAYGAAKARIFSDCETAVVNADDPAVMALHDRFSDAASASLETPLPPGEAAPKGAGEGLRSKQRLFSMESGFPHPNPLPEGEGIKVSSFGLGVPSPAQSYGLVEHLGQIWLAAPRPVLALSALKIAGLHNAANALAALALADAAGIPRAASLKALQAYKGLPHRCAFVAEIDGARWYNDSKGTNVGSTLAAIRGLPAPVVWLGGGQGKGQDFSPLAAALAEKSSAAILFGEDAGKIEQAVFGSTPLWREPNLHAAIQRARCVAVPGASVLLSPACASFDQFKNYLDRGEQFERAVLELAA